MKKMLHGIKKFYYHLLNQGDFFSKSISLSDHLVVKLYDYNI